ncbi:protein regulator of cytokinesis 1 [Dioszegia hungarica]|uniref:Protein regulator of cytokinesis 1 n=1 Tax=Dioszegia hungarica TaxID=4972 RepID=A0AA38H4S5_9TREE|nr:protein regulator of cytokinesis 1 [Dioszegia hungarica]KAI9632711.1 protein regulator of cytokinesis 1 [Dioszegia hungarica]
MSAYLAEHLPHLQSLHAQLALDTTALQGDQERIETAIKAAVETLLRERELQVDEYKDVIAGQKRRLACLARAVGDKGRNVIQESRRESVENESLPKQLERLVKQSEELEKVYDERLKHIEKQQSYLNQLAILLGAPFEPAAPLAPIASGSNHGSMVPPAPGLARIVSGTAAGGRLSVDRKGRSDSVSVIPAPPTAGEEGLYDVSEAVTGELESRVTVALEERASRLVDLESSMHDLRTLHTELALPPIPLSHPHHFPLHLLPNRSTEETPGAQQGYERLLARVVTEKVGMVPGVDEEGGENEVEGDLESMQGVEPDVGLIRWVEEVRELWEKEQATRAIRIQAIYDQLEPLWQRLQLDQDHIDLFIQMNIGCSEAAIKAYEAELERCLELRRSSLSSFIVSVRAEIDSLWTELMLSDEEKSDFGAYINDDYCEELLAEHETYIEQLRAEIESKANLLPKVREWHALVVDEDELERAQTDPDRFKRRGGAMLREEKLRKRVTVAKPRVEQELLKYLPVWEEANERPFMVQGERVVDKIHNALEAKDQAKEAKKRIRMGLAPTAPPPRPLAPAKTIRPTPLPSTRSTASSHSTSISGTYGRKREAPTPTPVMMSMNKRQKVAQPPSVSLGTGTGMGTGIRQPSRTRIPSSVTSTSTSNRVVSGGTGSGSGSGLGRGRDPSSSPTLVSCLLPRPALSGKLVPPISSSRIPSYAATSTTNASLSIPGTGGGTSGKVQVPLPPLHAIAKANGRRPPRKSFRPRASVACGFGFISGVEVGTSDEGDGDGYGHGGQGEGTGMDMEMMEEEEGDVFE